MRISDWSSDVCSSDLQLDLADRAGLQCRVRDRSGGESHVGAARQKLLDQVGGEVDFDLEADIGHIGLQPRDKGGKAARRRDLARTDAHHPARLAITRSEEHTSELQSLMRISYAVFCLKKKKQI